MSLTKKEITKVVKSLTREFGKVAMFGYQKTMNGGFKLAVDSAPEEKKKDILVNAGKALGRPLKKDEIVYMAGRRNSEPSDKYFRRRS